MGSEALNITTNRELLDALRKASMTKQTPSQLLEQRASFVYGSMDSSSNITKAQIKRALAEQDGGQGK